MNASDIIADMNEKRDENVKVRDGESAGSEKTGGIENLMRLSEYMRESGWDDTGSRLLRARLARAGGMPGPKRR